MKRSKWDDKKVEISDMASKYPFNDWSKAFDTLTKAEVREEYEEEIRQLTKECEEKATKIYRLEEQRDAFIKKHWLMLKVLRFNEKVKRYLPTIIIKWRE